METAVMGVVPWKSKPYFIVEIRLSHKDEMGCYEFDIKNIFFLSIIVRKK